MRSLAFMVIHIMFYYLILEILNKWNFVLNDQIYLSLKNIPLAYYLYKKNEQVAFMNI